MQDNKKSIFRDVSITGRFEMSEERDWNYRDLGFKPMNVKLNADRHTKFQKDAEIIFAKCDSLNDIAKKNSILIAKYGNPILITSKGSKVLDSVGKKMYRGLKLSQKELEMMIYLGNIKIKIEAVEHAANIIESLTIELKDRFDVVLTEWIKATLTGDYYKKGYVEPNHDYIPETREILVQLLQKNLEEKK